MPVVVSNDQLGLSPQWYVHETSHLRAFWTRDECHLPCVGWYPDRARPCRSRIPVQETRTLLAVLAQGHLPTPQSSPDAVARQAPSQKTGECSPGSLARSVRPTHGG